MSRLYISMYHYTRDLKNSRYPEIKGLDRELFEKQLIFFKENFNVIRMEDLIDSIYNGKKLPDKSLLLTFDDGYIDNYTVALPLLKKYGFQGSFFIPAKTFCENKILDVNKIHFILAIVQEKKMMDQLYEELLEIINEYRESDNSIEEEKELIRKYAIANRFDDEKTVFCKRVLQTALPEKIRNEITDKLFDKYVGIDQSSFAKELYMDEDQISLMKDNGMFIGIHGYDHYWLGNLEEKQMKEDIDKAMDKMKKFISDDNWVMNYPYGSHNDKVISYIKDKGFKLALTTEVRVADLDLDNAFKLPRLDCNDFPPKSDNYLKL